MDDIMAESEAEEESEVNIARRTRSHLRIDGFVPDDNLDFPDVDMKMYQNAGPKVDTEYKKFLSQTYSLELGTETTNNDDNDPEYIYNDHVLSPGWKFDLNEEFQQEDTDDRINLEQPQDIVGNEYGKPTTSAAPKTPNKALRRKIDMFDDPEFARILNQQLRQHIQLLTQTFLLTKNTTDMKNESEEARSHLESYMKIFKNKSKPSNLLPALDLVNNLQTPKDVKSSIRLSWRQLPVAEPVKYVIHKNPHVFVYPSLHPRVAFSILPEKLFPKKKSKINFTLNEDKLLAYALHEFKGESSQYAFIASLLMTAKTKTQISNHIKNIKRSPGNENNPIKLYYSKGELPEIDLDGESSLIAVEDLEHIEDFETDVTEKPIKNETPTFKEPPIPTHVLLSKLEQDQKPFLNHRDDELESVAKIDSKVNVQLDPGSESELEAEHNQEGEPELETEQETDQDPDYEPEIDPDIEDDLEPEAEPELDLEEKAPTPSDICCTEFPGFEKEQEDLMNMDLDDLMAASTTISKTTTLTANNSEIRNLKNLKLKKSMIDLMSHNFTPSSDMGNLIIYDFLKSAQTKLSERNNIHLLQLLTDLMRLNDVTKESENSVVVIFNEITKFLNKIDAPQDLHDRVVLFLDLDQATKCGCALNYLHWMRFFEFMQHVELYHDGVEALDRKLSRLIDALQKDDQHKIKLAIGNLINKHPFLKREFESLSMNEKPHPSLFLCEEDFDDITDPISMFDANKDYSDMENTHDDNERNDDNNGDEKNNHASNVYEHEHFTSKVGEDELSYASQSCPCKCHSCNVVDGQQGQHCDKCNLKFIKNRMYLVNKIKPILAEWSYCDRPLSPVARMGPPASLTVAATATTTLPAGSSTGCTQPVLQTQQPQRKTSTASGKAAATASVPSWTFEEDREILEFCRAKAEQNEETVSFDASTFEELLRGKRQAGCVGPSGGSADCSKRSSREIAERFNQLMEMYKDENSNSSAVP